MTEEDPLKFVKELEQQVNTISELYDLVEQYSP
jgi:hypothetical protein